MYVRPLSLLTAAAVVAALPLAAPALNAPHGQLAVSLSARPVTIGVQIATHPLDLAHLSAADFGDHDQVR